MKRIWLLHPLLFAVFPILFLYVRNAEKMRLSEIIEPLGLGLAAAIGAVVLFSLICRSLNKGALIATIGLLLFFSFGHAVEVLPEVRYSVAGLVLKTADCVAAGWSLLFLAAVIYIFRSARPMNSPTSILGKLGLFLEFRKSNDG